MTDATTGQGAEGARRGEKATGDGPAGRAYVTGGQSNAPSGDRSKGPQGEESAPSAPIVAGHDSGRDGRDASTAEKAERAEKGEQDDGSRSPLVAGPAGHEAAARGEGSPREGSQRGRLLPHDECDKLSLRLQHAVAGFVDGPRASVEEADHVMEEVASQVTDALTRRRRTLRHSWQQDGEDKNAHAGDTEQLRLALRDYRELADRLLHL
jgi:hypothetical protein